MNPNEIWASGGSYAPKEGNDVQIWIDGQESFAAIDAAIRGARSYIYAVFAYVDFGFRPVPERPECLLDLLQERARNGVDVRALIWHPGTSGIAGTIYDPGNREIPGTNGGPGTVQLRWDKAKGFGIWPAALACHHQKTFVIDGNTAFVGGLNSLQSYWDTPAHDPSDLRRVPFNIAPDQRLAALPRYPPIHDSFARVSGPCAGDVEANFVERWNGATFPHRRGTRPAAAHPNAVAPSGPVKAQVVRTIAPETYSTIPKGEMSVKEAYLKAIQAAQSSIYFENQYYLDRDVEEALEEASKRGVKVIGLLARKPDAGTPQGIMEQIWERVQELEIEGPAIFQEVNTALYCPVVSTPEPNASGRYRFSDIYVHGKALIVDDAFLTLGSANISFTSMGFHSEMNLVFNDPAIAKAVRLKLWSEHLRMVPADLDPISDPEKQFQLWTTHGQKNVAAFKNKTQPASRVFPFPFEGLEES